MRKNICFFVLGFILAISTIITIFFTRRYYTKLYIDIENNCQCQASIKEDREVFETLLGVCLGLLFFISLSVIILLFSSLDKALKENKHIQEDARKQEDNSDIDLSAHSIELSSDND